MQLQFLTEAEDGQDLRPELKPLYEDLSNAINDLRGISHSLNGDMIGRTGLAAALRKELDSIQRRGKLSTSLHIDKELRLTPSQELLLFRIAQEAITNVLKHAGATKISVSLRMEGQALILRIEDNGRGVATGISSQGMGIMNMQERALTLGGELKVKGVTGRGTVVCIVFPSGRENMAG